MKDILSAFSTDVFRPIITLFVPGTIAVSTWLIVLLQRAEKLKDLAVNNRVESAIVLVAGILFVGMEVENLGSWIESEGLDRWRSWRTKGKFKDDWQEYLLVAFKAEPVARRYLRALLQRFKFELDSGVGLIVASIGLIFVHDLSATCFWRLLLAGLVGGHTSSSSKLVPRTS